MWNQLSFHHPLISANEQAGQPWGLSLGFTPDERELESWFYSLVAWNKELTHSEFPSSYPLNEGSTIHLVYLVPTVELNDVRKEPSTVPHTSLVPRQ